MILLIVLIILAVYIIYTTSENEHMVKLKSRYYSFINKLPDKYEKIKKPTLLTGLLRTEDIGSNVNKGGEIYICIDGDTNDQFHVLLHELSHSLVSEYDHSDGFWDKYKELKDTAIQMGYYKPIESKKYCGSIINDL
jgi:hypothetical protein